MNKYILRTSLVWIAVLVVVVAAFLYQKRGRHAPPANANVMSPGNVAPVAAGPALPQNATVSPSQNTQPHLAPIQLTPQQMQSIGVTTGTAEFKQIDSDVRAPGNVDIDQRLVSYVQVRFPGYIRQVFANAVYQYVHKGEPLFSIYSPDLVATQRDYLLALQNQKALRASTVDGVASGVATLASAASERLQQWQVSKSQLAQLSASGKPITNLTINSPVSGYITECNALPNMYAEPATHLYTIADLSRVWVYAQVFQDVVGQVKPGDRAQITVDAYPGLVFLARVDEVLPQVDVATRTVRVRLVIANSALKLKPGMFVNVEIKAALGRALVIPESAVLQSGSRQLVFLYQDDGRIVPKEVTLGPSTEGGFVVLNGLRAHQRIVTSANFLVDSESQLQSAVGSFAPPPPGAGQAAAMKMQANFIAFSTDPNPPRKGNNNFTVKLSGPSGAPITRAQVTVTFYMPAMPAMNMGALEMTSTLADASNGIYRGMGLLPSSGTWQVTITARKDGNTIATKQLNISATGGM